MELKDQTGEQLAILLQQQYQMIMQCNQNLTAINNELNERMKPKDDGRTEANQEV